MMIHPVNDHFQFIMYWYSCFLFPPDLKPPSHDHLYPAHSLNDLDFLEIILSSATYDQKFGGVLKKRIGAFALFACSRRLISALNKEYS